MYCHELLFCYWEINGFVGLEKKRSDSGILLENFDHQTLKWHYILLRINGIWKVKSSKWSYILCPKIDIKFYFNKTVVYKYKYTEW